MVQTNQLDVRLIGAGMIVEETHFPLLEAASRKGLFDWRYGVVTPRLVAIGSRTGARAEMLQRKEGQPFGAFDIITEPCVVRKMFALCEAGGVVIVATPDNRHFEAARAAVLAGQHVLIEKPSVLTLDELDQLKRLAHEKGVLVKVVYHKLLDPDHKNLRTWVRDGVLKHVNHGYCSLLEPKQISGKQFAEWIRGRNPGTYVAVHWIKLIDFTFGGQLKTVACTGQRGIVGPPDGDTWDSTQLRLVYGYEDGREAAFDIHTSWVTPDNFSGWVEQEVQFRFDNGLWNGHSRKRGVEACVEGETPLTRQITVNSHFAVNVEEPWGERLSRGYGLEAIERFLREAAFVEFGQGATRGERLARMRQLAYNDIGADRQTVAAVQAMEAILAEQAAGKPDCIVRVNTSEGGLVLLDPGSSDKRVLYDGGV